MLVATCTNIWNLLKQEKVKVKQMHYPAIGLLALLEDGEKEIYAIKALIENCRGEIIPLACRCEYSYCYSTVRKSER